jgi:O-antigen/teichoic acid export membrane protein
MNSNPSIPRHRTALTMSLAWLQSAIMLICGLANLPLLLHHFPTQEVGLWLLLQSIAGYLALLDFGLSQTLIRLIAVALGGNNPTKAKAIASTGLLIYAILFIVSFFLAGLALLLLPTLLSLAPSSVGIARTLWLWLSAGFLVRLWTTPILALLQGSGYIHRYKLFSIISSLLQLAGTIFIVFSGVSLVWVGVNYFLITIFISSISYFFARKHLSNLIPSLSNFQPKLLKPLLANSSHWFLFSLSTNLIWGTDLIVISHFLGSEVIVAYGAAMKLAMIALDFITQPGSTLTPAISAAIGAQNQPRLHRLYKNGQFINLNLAFFMACGLWVFGPTSIVLWLGIHQFVGHSVWLIIVMVVALHGWNHFNTVMLFAGTNTLPVATTCFMQGAVNLLLSLLLVETYGIKGVILGTLLAEILIPQWRLPLLVCREFSISFLKTWICWLSRSIAPQLFLIVATLLGTLLDCSLWQQALLFALGAIIGTFAAWNISFDDEMKRLILKFIPSFLHQWLTVSASPKG